jgi:hypothetical protein
VADVARHPGTHRRHAYAVPDHSRRAGGRGRRRICHTRSDRNISDLLDVHDDTVRLFHQTLIEFLIRSGSPFFVNRAQGATRLLDFLSDRVAFTSLVQQLKEFCRQNFGDWLLECQELARYSAILPQLYDQLYFSRPTAPLPYYVCGVTVGERDRRLISYLMAGGFADTVASILSLAFMGAAARFRAAGTDPWICLSPAA